MLTLKLTDMFILHEIVNIKIDVCWQFSLTFSLLNELENAKLQNIRRTLFV